MTTYNLTPSVERASQDLFNHFKEIYGKLIFIPLGIGEGTPAKVAP